MKILNKKLLSQCPNQITTHIAPCIITKLFTLVVELKTTIRWTYQILDKNFVYECLVCITMSMACAPLIMKLITLNTNINKNTLMAQWMLVIISYTKIQLKWVITIHTYGVFSPIKISSIGINIKWRKSIYKTVHYYKEQRILQHI